MAGFTTIDTVLYRVQRLIRAYLATETALIDTRNNAIAVIDSATENNFTSPSVASANVQLHEDRLAGNAARIVIMDDGRTTKNDLELRGRSHGAVSTEPNATMPRFDDNLAFSVVVLFSDTDGSHGQDGARLRCNRLALGVRAVLARHTDLTVPSGSAVGIIADVIMRDFGKPEEYQSDTGLHCARRLKYEARVVEDRT